MTKQILIVDDNLTILRQVGLQLQSSYDITLAKSGLLALQICRTKKPDLILLDIEMPEMDGYATMERIMADPELRHIPVIFLTGSYDSATEVRALQSGAMDFITKPANASLLLHKIAMHLAYADYQSKLETSLKELEDNIIVSFAELLECKDENAGDHVLRTSRYAELLGRRLLQTGIFGAEFDEEKLEMMIRAVPFHDVGKIGISDTILLKPEPLSQAEYEEVKRHTVIGAQMLEKIYEHIPTRHYLHYAGLIAEGHHEYWDGTGYPHGLAGDDIPLCSRIAAVVNVYSACCIDKVYRKGHSHEESCRIVVQGKGTAFDPRVVTVLEEISDQFAELTIKTRPLLKIDLR
ncbi:MAG: response regulator [Desulfovibrio sp.]|jgi:putative two-component system response regulator|nr:response regulator [Desulfovibrio sp.]